MYTQIYNLCNANDTSIAITTNKHFLSPHDCIYSGFSQESQRLNVKPSFWGPPAWKFLFSVAVGYEQNPTALDRRKMRDFLHTLGDTLPCVSCRENFEKNLETLSETDLDGPKQLKAWLQNVRKKIESEKKDDE